MKALNKQALREAAIHAQSSDDWGYDDDNFHDQATPDVVLALLDELEATQKTSEARRNAILRTHNMFQKQRGRAEAAEKRIAELEARTVSVHWPVPKDSTQGWKVDPEFISKVQDAIGYDEECQCWEGTPSMEMVESVLIAAAGIKLDVRS